MRKHSVLLAVFVIFLLLGEVVFASVNIMGPLIGQLLYYSALFIAAILYLYCAIKYLKERKKDKHHWKCLIITTAITIILLSTVAMISWFLTGGSYIVIPYALSEQLDCWGAQGYFGQQCYYNLAMEKEDPTICDKFPDSEPQGYSSNWASTAPYLRKSSCLRDLAKKTKDPSICKKIKYQLVRDHCLAVVTQNSSLCEGISGRMRNTCYLEVVAVTKDPRICEKMGTDPNSLRSCYDILSYYYQKQNLGVCESITGADSENRRDACYRNIAKVKWNPSICDKIQSQSYKDECYYGVAIVNRNSSLCDRIQRELYKYECYENVARSRGDYTPCDNIPDQHYRDKCYCASTDYNKNLSICDKIQDQNCRYMCYGSVARAKKDTSICDKIQDQNEKDTCYHYVTSGGAGPGACIY